MPPDTPPNPTPGPRVICSVQQAVAIHEALCSLGHAVRRLKEAGLSHDEIEEAFRAEMAGDWDEATE